MNCSYRIVWSDVQQAFVAVAENVRARGKRGTVVLAASAALTLLTSQDGHAQQAPPVAIVSNALPVNGRVASGTATISQLGNTLTINQATQKLITNWDSFNIGSAAAVNFQQPNASSAALNRVNAADPSYIFGNLTANGQVYLINPSGIVFGAGSQVNVGGLVASSLALSDSNFLAGNNQFGTLANASAAAGNTATYTGGTGYISNAGTIRTASGGYVAFVSPRIENTGSISTPQGAAVLVAGDAVSLDFSGDKLIGYTVTQGALNALVENSGAIRADDGLVVLSAKAADSLTRSVVNQSGIVEANSLTAKGGRVLLEGDDITLAAGSQTNATGAMGGGAVLVGGDWQGGTAPGAVDMRQAVAVTMAPGAGIDVSATNNGDGGKAVLWSDVGNANSVTTAQGSIVARGAGSGNGGQVETSGHSIDIDSFHVDTRAASDASGKTGLWLIDPYDYTIGSSQASAIGTALNTSDVTVTTSANSTSYGASGNSGNTGNITVNSAISGANNLTLNAANNIAVNANLSTTGNGKAIQLISGGDITLAASAAIGSNNGNISLVAQGNIFGNTGATVSSGAGNIVLASDSDASGGGSIGLNGVSLTSTGGNITLGGGNSAGTGYAEGTTASYTTTTSGSQRGIMLLSGTQINAGGGNISLMGKGYQGSAGSVWEYSIGVDLGQGATLQTSGSGTITLNGVGGVNSGSANQSAGINFFTPSTIISISTGSGAITLTGTASPTTNSGRLHAGINQDGGSAQIYSTSGNITLTGIGVSTDTGINQGSGSTLYVGRNSGNTVTTSGNLRLTADSLSFAGAATLAATGTLIVVPNSSSFSSALNWPISNVTLGTGLTGLTLGNSTNTANITIASATSIAGPITVYGSNIILNANLTSTASGAGISLLASGNIVGNTAGISLSTNGGNVLLASDTDNSGAGTIALDRTSITTSGGNITLGGGDVNGSGYAVGAVVDTFSSPGAAYANYHGITLQNATLNAGGGNIVLRGKGSLTATPSGTYAIGILITSLYGYGTSGNTLSTSGSGTISITGVGGNNNDSTTFGSGIEFYSATSGVNTISTVSGGISISGTVGTGTASLFAGMTESYGTLNIVSQQGSVSLQGITNSTSQTGLYVPSGAILNVGGDGTTNTSGNATLTADSISSGGTLNLRNTGTLTLQPYGTSFASAFTWLASGMANIGSKTGLTLGKSGNTANVTVASTTSIAGPITVYGGAVALNANLATTNTSTGDVSITTTGLTGSGGVSLATGHTLSVSQSGNATYSGVVLGTNANLSVSGSGNLTLTGANTYSGTTTVAGGATLTVGTGSTNGSLGTGSVADNGTLVFNRSDAVTLANAISGTGNVSVAGTGAVTLTGVASYSGVTTVTSSSITYTNNTLPSTSGFSGAGTVTIQPATSSSFSSAFTPAYSFASTLTGLTMGSSSNTANITLNNAISIAGPIAIYGGAITLNAGLTATGSPLTLQGTGNVTEGSNGYVSASNLLLSGGNVTLTNMSNAIGTLAASGVSGLSFVNGSALTIGTVGSTSGVSATGAVSIGTQSGNLTLAQNVATTNTTATALTLNAGIATAAGTSTGGNLIVSGGPTVSVGTGGTATLYTGSVSGSTGLAALVGGSGSGRFRYDSDESATNYTLALSTGLNAVYREQPTVTVAINNQTMTYAGTAPTYTFALNSGDNGDTYAQAFATNPTVTVGGSASSSGNYIAGTHTLSSATALTSQLGYAVGSTTNGTLTVNQKVLTYTGTSASRAYSGSTVATMTDSASGIVTGSNSVQDNVTVSSSGAQFGDPNAGTGKTVTVSGIALTGTDAANYSIANTATLTSGVITPKTVTLSASKTYDGTTSLAGDVTIGGLVNSETLTYSGATASDAHVATSGKYISAITLVNGANGGLASNYQLPTLNTAYAGVTITAQTLTPSVINTGVSKQYDGTTNAPAGFTPTYSVTGFIAGDTGAALTNTGAAYNSQNVSTANQITVSGLAINGITGSHSSVASDYALAATSASTGASITAKTVTLSASKPYDGTTSLSGSDVTIGGLIGSETLNYSGATASDAHVATSGKYINAITLANGSNGGLASNYQLPTLNAAYAGVTITAQTVTDTVTIGGALTKPYDGNTTASAATINSTFAGGAAGDTFTLTGLTLVYNNAHVANASSISASGTPGFNIASTSKGSTLSDYNFTAPTIVPVSASITPVTLTTSLINTGVSKQYDGTTNAPTGFTPTYSVTGFIAGDTGAALTNTGAAYNSQNVSTANQITLSGLAINGITGSNGSAASDYALAATSASIGASITPKTITLSASKPYDGTTSLSGSDVTMGGLIGSETLNYSGATASNADVATSGKYINAITLANGSNGGLASNYQLPTLNAAYAGVTITAQTVTDTATISGALTKPYDDSSTASAAIVNSTFAGGAVGDAFALRSNNGGGGRSLTNPSRLNSDTTTADGKNGVELINLNGLKSDRPIVDGANGGTNGDATDRNTTTLDSPNGDGVISANGLNSDTTMADGANGRRR